MTTTQTKQIQLDSIDELIVLIIAIISIIITEFISCFTPLPKKSLQLLVTNPSTKKKGSSSTRRSVTSKTLPKVQSLAPVTSTEISKESSVVIGSPSTGTKNSKVGTTSQPTKKSRSGALTQSRSPQVKTRSNRTIQTAGLGFLA